MKRCIARQFLIARLAVSVLVAVSLMQTQVQSQGMTGNSYLVIFPSVGLAPGENLRLTLFKPDGVPVRAQAQIHHTGGILVGMGDGSVRGGAFHSFDFKRSDIPLPGEEGTGRLQLRASFHITTAKSRRKIGTLVVSMETTSISDGTSNTIFVSEITPPTSRSGGGDDLLVGGDGRDILMGIVPGQALRVTLLNPPSSDSEAGSGVEAQTQGTEINGHIKVFDAGGLPIAQSDELVIPPGEFRSFDIERSELPVAGEPGTDRAQVRIKPFFDFRSERLSPVLVSYELVDKGTGQTQVLSGDQCLVFFLGGTRGS